MINKYLSNISWDFLSKLTIAIFLTLQLVRWVILPQYMDVYYHLLTAWGFLQSGGYSGWDFWQYAPVGRVHIYPPLFHLILSLFMKLGLSQVVLAKVSEILFPWLLLLVTWKFTRKNYSSRLAFFVTILFFSSFAFYLSLLNHIPSTIALIFAVLSLGELLKNKLIRSAILLSLCFYTHIGVSVYLTIVFFILGIFSADKRKGILKVVIIAAVLAMPAVIKQLASLGSISALGYHLSGGYLLKLKFLEPLLALAGLAIAFRQRNRYALFLSLFISSFIFILYPNRFFCEEGYFALIFPSALTMDYLYTKIKLKYAVAGICAVILLFSPTLLLNLNHPKENWPPKVIFSDSAFAGMLFAKGQTLWFPNEYMEAASIIRENSKEGDIVFSTLNIAGLAVSSLSGRASANALLPEVREAHCFDPLLSSKIIIFTVIDEEDQVDNIVDFYKLSLIGKNKFFRIYKNTHSLVVNKVERASIPFWLIFIWGLVLILLYKFVKNI